jgi:type I restriction enzyme S subunit
MEVMPGYKQTEVGVIPEDWECTTVGQLAQNGVIHKPMDGNHGNIHPKSGDFVSFGIPFVMANNVRNGSVDLSNCSFIRKEQADSLQKGFSLPGDVLLTHKATIGNTAVVGEIPFEYIMLTPQVTYYRVADRTRLNNQYLRHYFDSHSFQKVLISMSGGGTRAYIGITAQLQLSVIVPPLPEQEAITEVLSKADAIIETFERLIAKKRLLKKGVMQQLLTGKRRLRGFANATTGYKQTEVGVIPEDWEVKQIGELKPFVTSGSRGWAAFYSDRGAPFIRITNLSRDSIYLDLEDLRLVNLPNDSSEGARTQLRDRDVLISITADIGIIGYVSESVPKPAYINQHIALVRFDSSNTNPVFVSYFLASEKSQKLFRTLTDSGAKAGMSLIMVQKIHLALPPTKAEQDAIAEVLNAIDAEVALLEAQLAKYRQLKQGLMQKLLTGRIRLV